MANQVEVFSSTMRSINTEPTMPRQPTKPTNLLISTPFSEKTVPDQTVCPGRLAGRAHDGTRLDQPLIMVVVLVVIARTAACQGGSSGVQGRTGGRQTWCLL